MQRKRGKGCVCVSALSVKELRGPFSRLCLCHKCFCHKIECACKAARGGHEEASLALLWHRPFSSYVNVRGLVFWSIPKNA